MSDYDDFGGITISCSDVGGSECGFDSSGGGVLIGYTEAPDGGIILGDSCSGSSDNSPEAVYHYTDAAGVEAITESGFIKGSEAANGDAVFGDGVYLTAIPPTESTKTIVENNWDGLAMENPEIVAKTEYCVAVPTNQIPEVEVVEESERDIYVYPKQDLTIDDKDVTIYHRVG